jgi:ABC-type lipoprotein export system ATPase subunit
MITHEADIAACAKRVIYLKDGVILKDYLNKKKENRKY